MPSAAHARYWEPEIRAVYFVMNYLIGQASGEDPRGEWSIVPLQTVYRTSRLRLLELVETMGEGLSWRERMDLWNEFHLGEQYKDRRNFSKAYREVRAKVLEPGYSPVERDEQATREDHRFSIKRKLKAVGRSLSLIRHVERAQKLVRDVSGEAT